MRSTTTTVLAIAFIAFAITACTSTGNNDVRRLDAPSYATRTGAETYSISCGGGANITLRRSSMEDFYHENGEMKTLAEFCKEYDPATLIRKQ